MFDMMKKVKEMQEKMGQLQEELAQLEVEGVSGGGLVKVTLNGKGEMKAVSIDPSLFKPEEADMVEDLIIAAHTDAKNRSEQQSQEKMKELTGDLPLPPGMKLF